MKRVGKVLFLSCALGNTYGDILPAGMQDLMKSATNPPALNVSAEQPSTINPPKTLLGVTSPSYTTIAQEEFIPHHRFKKENRVKEEKKYQKLISLFDHNSKKIIHAKIKRIKVNGREIYTLDFQGDHLINFTVIDGVIDTGVGLHPKKRNKNRIAHQMEEGGEIILTRQSVNQLMKLIMYRSRYDEANYVAVDNNSIHLFSLKKNEINNLLRPLKKVNKLSEDNSNELETKMISVPIPNNVTINNGTLFHNAR